MVREGNLLETRPETWQIHAPLSVVMQPVSKHLGARCELVSMPLGHHGNEASSKVGTGTRSDAAAPARKASSKLGPSKESPCLDVVPYTGGYHPVWYHLRSQAEAPRHFPHSSSADQFAASSTGGGLPGAQGRLNVSNTQENDLAGVAEKREKPTRSMFAHDTLDDRNAVC